MRQFVFLYLLFVLPVVLQSQTCLPSGITFSTQQQINDFTTNYPGCTQILGNVIIDEATAGNITNLSGLSSITSIGGYLRVWSNTALTSLSGLSNLTSIGNQLWLLQNSALNNLGLSSLSTIGSSLLIQNNGALTTLSGLNNLTSTTGLSITGNTTLSDISALSSLTSTSSITIQQNPALINLNGLNSITVVNGAVAITTNAGLTSLSGLSNLTSVSSYLWIKSNSTLTSLSGLSNLSYVGGAIEIWQNNLLANVDGLSGFSSIGGNLQIFLNPNLTSLSAFNNLTTIGGYLEIQNNAALTNLSGLNNLVSIGGALRLYNNNSLSNLNALNNLTSIGGLLLIQNNPGLTSLSGLDNISYTSITNLQIESSTSLSTCSVQSICDYLEIPSNPATISGNATSCASRTVVEAACTALPIEIISFYAEANNHSVLLEWETEMEVNNKLFEILRSKNGIEWEVIGQKEAHGTSNTRYKYSFIDFKPHVGINYYRLKQVDFDNSYHWYGLISVSVGDDVDFKVYPNPFLEKIKIEATTQGPLTIRIRNGAGVTLLETGMDEVDLSNYPSGLYLIEIITQDWAKSKRIMKM